MSAGQVPTDWRKTLFKMFPKVIVHQHTARLQPYIRLFDKFFAHMVLGRKPTQLAMIHAISILLITYRRFFVCNIVVLLLETAKFWQMLSMKMIWCLCKALWWINFHDGKKFPAISFGLTTVPLSAVQLSKLDIVRRRVLRSMVGWVAWCDVKNGSKNGRGLLERQIPFCGIMGLNGCPMNTFMSWRTVAVLPTWTGLSWIELSWVELNKHLLAVWTGQYHAMKILPPEMRAFEASPRRPHPNHG